MSKYNLENHITANFLSIYTFRNGVMTIVKFVPLVRTSGRDTYG